MNSILYTHTATHRRSKANADPGHIKMASLVVLHAHICTCMYVYQVICIRDLNEGYNAWKQWLRNTSVPRRRRYDALTANDKKNWTPLHYASRFYRPDILDIAKDLESGDATGMYIKYVLLFV